MTTVSYGDPQLPSRALAVPAEADPQPFAAEAGRMIAVALEDLAVS